MRNIGAIYITIGAILVLSLTPLLAQGMENNDFILAKKSFQDGFYEIAARSFEKFISDNPNNEGIIEARLLLGESFVHLERFNDAIKEFEVVLNSGISDLIKAEAIYWKAEIYFRTRDFGKARELYAKLLSDHPLSKYTPHAEYSTAWSLYEEKKYDQALDKFSA
ncbi:MAG: tetratricopeptide repeat protein, partial [Candidatus Omnitrophica bacterium]|nr:tetratricopeptide repeat protein [Candidatus Omnitrophota bacterium]